MGLRNELRHAWNAFRNLAYETPSRYEHGASSYGRRPGQSTFSVSNERSIISAAIMRMGIDAAAVGMYHARVDENGYFQETIPSGLNECLTVEANLDQDARAFRQDLVMSMMDRGVVALVPTDTSVSPLATGGYDIKSMRVAQIVTWYPRKVTVRVYNEDTGLYEDITLPKTMVTIVENPLSSVMNAPNSTLQRLIAKLNLLDAVDDQSGSGKLDIIIQMPYSVRSETRQAQAESRRVTLEDQMRNSKYGVGYIDATEKITQLNRPAENNLLTQVQYLTEMLYGQLGITQAVMEGTADEAAMLNYHNRTIEPILSAIAGGMTRTFLTKTARTQNQKVVFIRDPFKLLSVADIAEIADKFTRNEIVTSNEMRGIMGMRPSKDPKADELRNKNVPAPIEEVAAPEAVDVGELQPAIESPTGSRVRSIMEGE